MLALRRASAVFACCALVAAIVCAAGAAGNSAGFDDRVGEVTEAADISRVEASNDDSGHLTVRVQFANRPSGLDANDSISLYLDTDENAATGSSSLGLGLGGFDQELDFFPARGDCRRGQAFGGYYGGFTALPQGSLTCNQGPGVVTFAINRADLGGASGVNLLATSYIFDPVVNGVHLHDLAPDCGEAWNYKIAGSPTPAPDPCAAEPPPPPPPPPPPAPAPGAAHRTVTLTRSRTSAPVSVPVELATVDVIAVASRRTVGFNLGSFKNVVAGRVGAAALRLKIAKRLTRLKVTAHVTGVEPGKLRFRVLARRVARKTRVRVTVTQRNE